MGSERTSSVLTTRPSVALAVSSSETSAVTVTDSLRTPISKIKFSSTRPPTLRVIPLRTVRLNPSLPGRYLVIFRVQECGKIVTLPVRRGLDGYPGAQVGEFQGCRGNHGAARIGNPTTEAGEIPNPTISECKTTPAISFKLILSLLGSLSFPACRTGPRPLSFRLTPGE